MMVLAAVPESITRSAYLGLLSAVGLDPDSLKSVEFRTDGIYAEVFARDEAGRMLVDGDEIVINRVFVPVVG